MSKDFEALVRTHQAAVCAIAYSVLRDRPRAEEVAQDAFLLAWQKLPSLAEPPALPAWICGIARNLARNAARKKREVAVLDDRDDVATSSEGPLDSLLSSEAWTLAERALATLGEQDREAITLYYMGEGEHADVARALGITEANARQRVHRAREKLRDAAASVEKVVRAARPGPAFTAACVAALAAGKAVDAQAATAAKASAVGKPLAVIAGAVAVIGGAIFVATSRAPSLEPRTTPATQLTPSPNPQDIGSASRVAIDRAAVLHRISKATRAEMVARLRGSGSASSTSAPVIVEPPTKVYDFSGGPLESAAPLDPPPPDASPKRLLRYAIQELQPLLVECHKGLPSSGTLAMHVVLLGGPAGTIVESVEIDPEGSAAAFEPSFTECMQETLYAIELPPMPMLERWDLHYPFVVSPSP